MDSRIERWQNGGMVAEDIIGLSLAERHKFVTLQNVWGICAWKDWVDKGYNSEDVYYIWRIFELIPKEVYFDGYPAYKDIADKVYCDYIEQVTAIKEYLFSQVKAGTLDRAKWLEQLYTDKGWGFIRHMHGQCDEFVFEQNIFYDCVITASLLRFVHSFKFRSNKTAFHTEFLCQDFPNNFSLLNINPRIDERFVGNDMFEYIVTIPDFKFCRVCEGREEFMQILEKGEFMEAYKKFKNPKAVVMTSETNELSTAVTTPETYTLMGYRYVRGSYRKMFIIQNSKGELCEMSESMLKEKMEQYQINGVSKSDSGTLIFPNGLTKL